MPPEAHPLRSQRDRMLAVVAPALLGVVAAMQCFVVHRYHLSPWKGGGFGMFSSIDGSANRAVLAYLHDGVRRHPIDIYQLSEIRTTIQRARALPTPAALRQLAQTVGRMPWGRRGGEGRPSVVRVPDGTMVPLQLRAVEVEVWRVVADRSAGAIGRQLLGRGEWRWH